MAAIGDKAAMEKQIAETKYVNELTVILLKDYAEILKVDSATVNYLTPLIAHPIHVCRM